MKKLFLTLTAVLMLFFALTACGHAHNYGEWETTKEATKVEDGLKERVCTCGEKETEIIYATGSVGLEFDVKVSVDGLFCVVSSIGTCTDTKIIIPSTISGYKVTAIAESAFEDCSNITEIIIPNTVASIHKSAFYDCSGLTSITIPDSVMSIGSSAFSGCSSLTSITIPDSVTSIGDSAFYNCTSLTSITIPDSVTSIGSSTFSGCSSLTSITFGENSKLTSIGEEAFSDCTSLTSITIPNSVTSIARYAFYGCTSLTSITIPDSVTSIDYWAFYYCKSLTSITFGGTKAQWESISKDSYWNYNTPTITVTCTDGVYSTTY